MKNKTKVLTFLLTITGLIILVFSSVVFSDNNIKKQTTKEQADKSQAWWKQVKADVVLGEFNYYADDCSILQVNAKDGTAKTIFEVPHSYISTCKNRSTPLTYDGEFLIYHVCITEFGAGSCGAGRYRSADMLNWQVQMGITWIKGEQYEAWRNLGSKSLKADAVKKVIEN